MKFADAASAAAAVARANGLVVSGHTLRVDSASRGKAGEAFDAKRSVFLGNLPTKVTEEAVRKHFEAGLHSALLKIGGLSANAEVNRGDGGSGEELEKPLIEGVRVIRDPVTQVGKGFGYVLLRDRAAAAAALALHGSKLNGRELRVQVHTTLGNAQV